MLPICEIIFLILTDLFLTTMGEVIIYVSVTLISGAVGAWIGTYCGAYFSAQREDKRKKDMRNIAIKGLNIIKKYSVKGNTYDVVEAEFNNF